MKPINSLPELNVSAIAIDNVAFIKIISSFFFVVLVFGDETINPTPCTERQHDSAAAGAPTKCNPNLKTPNPSSYQSTLIPKLCRTSELHPEP